MKVSKWLLPVLALTLLMGTVGVAQALGVWQVSGKEMVNVDHLTSGADVKGWMTLQQIADGSDIDTVALYLALGLPAEIPPTTALKDLEQLVDGLEVSLVREVVDSMLGAAPAAEAPVTPEVQSVTHTATPAPTVAPTPTAAHAPQGDGAGAGAGEDGTPPAVTSAMDIKGRHTLQEVADGTGIALADLLAALKLPAEIDPNTAMRDLVESGLISEIETVRTAVATLQSE